MTSAFCLVEAERNLVRKLPGSSSELDKLMRYVLIVPEASPSYDLAAHDLPTKDIPVWRAANAARAEVLVTEDVKHFGDLMRKEGLAVRVMTLASFLRAGGRR